jgi:O-antigen/teichoic acid export membrane protein
MSLARAVTVTTASLVAARLVAIVAGIGAVALASRHLGPEGYGALSTAMAFASIFAVLTDFGVSTVAAREISIAPERERAILGNVVLVGLLVAVGAGALAMGLTFLAYPGDGNADIREGTAILLVQLLAAPVTGAARAHFTAAQRGHLIAIGDVALAVAMVGLTAAVVSAGLGFQAVVLATAGGYVAQGIAMGLLAARTGGITIAADRVLASRLLWLSLPLAGTMIVNYLYFRLDLLLLSWLKDQEAVAVYALAYRVLEALMVLPAYVMLALFPEIARRGAHSERLAPIVGAAEAGMLAIALPTVVLGITFAPEIVQVVGGDAYEDSATVLSILIVALAMSYLNGVYGNALLALGRQAALLAVTSAVLVVNLAVNLAMIPPWGVRGAAVAVVISEILAVFLVRRYYVKAAGRPATPPLGRIVAAAAVLAALGAAKLLLIGDLPALAGALGGGALGLVLYAGLLVGFRALPEPLASRLRIPGRS